jgi:signal transduction histidine kinase
MVTTFPRAGRDVITATGNSGVALAGSGRVALAAMHCRPACTSAVLVKGGLTPALRALARRSTVPVELETYLGARLPERVELGAYHVVSEALTNAAKHANATRVDIRVEETDGALRLTVRDDGTGGARFVPGSGLVGLKDRVEALGGKLSVESPGGAGTTLQVEIPLAGRSST